MEGFEEGDQFSAYRLTGRSKHYLFAGKVVALTESNIENAIYPTNDLFTDKLLVAVQITSVGKDNCIFDYNTDYSSHSLNRKNIKIWLNTLKNTANTSTLLNDDIEDNNNVDIKRISISAAFIEECIRDRNILFWPKDKLKS